MAATVLDVAKKIIRKAAEIGLDQAGSLMLPGSWKYFKIILLPIIKELEKKYPKMLFVDPENPNPDNHKAITSFENDQKLQDLLNTGFSRLSAGQKKISEDIQITNTKLDKLDSSIEDLGGITKEGFNDVLNAVNRSTGKQSPGKLNVIDSRVTEVKDERKYLLDFYVSNIGGSQVVVVRVKFKVLRTARVELIKGSLLPSGEYNLDITELKNSGDTISCNVSQIIDPGKSDLFRIILTATGLKSGVFAAWELQPELVTNFGSVATDQVQVFLPFDSKELSLSEFEQFEQMPITKG